MKYLFFGTCFTAFSLSFIYTGITIHIKDLYGDIFSNALLFFSTELIGNFASGFLINIKYLGRQGSMLLCYFIGVVFLILFFVLYENPEVIEEKIMFLGENGKIIVLI